MSSAVLLESIWTQLNNEFLSYQSVSSKHSSVIHAVFVVLDHVLNLHLAVSPEAVILFIGHLLYYACETSKHKRTALNSASFSYLEKHTFNKACINNLEDFKRIVIVSVLSSLRQNGDAQLLRVLLFRAISVFYPSKDCRNVFPTLFERLVDICEATEVLDRLLEIKFSQFVLLETTLLVTAGSHNIENVQFWVESNSKQTAQKAFEALRNNAYSSVASICKFVSPHMLGRLVENFERQENKRMFHFFIFTLLALCEKLHIFEKSSNQRLMSIRKPTHNENSSNDKNVFSNMFDVLNRFLSFTSCTMTSLQRATVTKGVLEILLKATHLSSSQFAKGFACLEYLLWPKNSTSKNSLVDIEALETFLECKGYKILSQFLHPADSSMSRVSLELRILMAALRQSLTNNRSTHSNFGLDTTSSAKLLTHFEWYFNVCTDLQFLKEALFGPKQKLAFQLLANWPSALADLLDRICFVLSINQETISSQALTQFLEYSPSALRKLRLEFFRTQSTDRLNVVFQLLYYCLLNGKGKHFLQSYLHLLSDSGEIFSRKDLCSPNFTPSKFISQIGALLNESSRVEVVQGCMTWLDRAITTYWRLSIDGEELYYQERSPPLESWAWHAEFLIIFETFTDRLGLKKNFFPSIDWDLNNMDSVLNFSTLNDTECRLRHRVWHDVVTRISLSQGKLFPRLILLPLYVLRAKTDVITKSVANNKDSGCWNISLPDLTLLLNDIRLPMFYITKCFGSTTRSSNDCSSMSRPLQLFTISHVLLSFNGAYPVIREKTKQLFWELRELTLGFVGTFFVSLSPFVVDAASVSLFVRLGGFELLECLLNLLKVTGPGMGRQEILETIIIDELADLPTRIVQLTQRCFEEACSQNSSCILDLLKFETLHKMFFACTGLTRLQLLQAVSTPLFGMGNFKFLMKAVPWKTVIDSVKDPNIDDEIAFLKSEAVILIVDLLNYEAIACKNLPIDAVYSRCFTINLKEAFDDENSYVIDSKQTYYQKFPYDTANIMQHLVSDDIFVLRWLLGLDQQSSASYNKLYMNKIENYWNLQNESSDHEFAWLENIPTTYTMSDLVRTPSPKRKQDFSKETSLQSLPKRCLELIMQFLV